MFSYRISAAEISHTSMERMRYVEFPLLTADDRNHVILEVKLENTGSLQQLQGKE